MRRSIWTWLRPVLRWVVRRLPVGDPWERMLNLGLGWEWLGPPDYYYSYRGRQSKVSADSLDEICDWLMACEYRLQPEHLCRRGGWPPADDFENNRRGDCKDHALWAWRKLNEIGVPAELLVGQCRSHDEDFQEFNPWTFSGDFFQGHAWVQFQQGGVSYLLDSTQKVRDAMIRPLVELRAYYLPWFGVGPACQRYKYWGFVCSVFRVASRNVA
jgi:hypothetical protein